MDTRALRNTLGQFATGVCILTTDDDEHSVDRNDRSRRTERILGRSSPLLPTVVRAGRPHLRKLLLVVTPSSGRYVNDVLRYE